MDQHTNIKSQYLAALAMLQRAIEACPDQLWFSPEHQNPFWQVAYHVTFYAHLYLHKVEEDFTPWSKHRDQGTSLRDEPLTDEDPQPYTQAEILEYIDFVRQELSSFLDATDLEGESGFHWLPFNKLELQFYNIRHIQQHAGELCERLFAETGIEIDWVIWHPDA